VRAAKFSPGYDVKLPLVVWTPTDDLYTKSHSGLFKLRKIKLKNKYLAKLCDLIRKKSKKIIRYADHGFSLKDFGFFHKGEKM